MKAQGDFAELLSAPETSRLEFKEAANRYDFEELVRYCVALANEGGGKVTANQKARRAGNDVAGGASPRWSVQKTSQAPKGRESRPLDPRRWDS